MAGLYDIRCTPETLRAAAAWVEVGDGMADVELLIDDTMLLVTQGDEQNGFDTGGEPASEEYLSAAPLDRGIERDFRDIRSPSLNAAAAAGWENYRRHLLGSGQTPRYLTRTWDKLTEEEQFAWVEAAKAIQHWEEEARRAER